MNTTEPEIFETEKAYRKKLREFGAKYETHMILTSRFTAETFAENEMFRKKNVKVGCIYCSPTPITSKLSEDKRLFVIEMNNSTNRIEGIGMIQNRPIVNKYKVYETSSYNRYTYIGRYRIAREDMTEPEEELAKVFDMVCFTGAKNLKRGRSITAFPMEVLYKCSKHIDLVDFIRKMFKNRFSTATSTQGVAESVGRSKSGGEAVGFQAICGVRRT
jgi:hypothetical protein